jgi:hypothetical protein
MTDEKKTDRKLYEWGTYNATQRLKDLRTGKEFLTLEDLKELLHEFQDGQEGWGDGTRNITLVEFGAWLLGDRYMSEEARGYGDNPPAEVVW